MEAVSDLPRLRRALSRALRIQTAAVTADDFDLRMLAKPFGCSCGCAIRQHIDNLAPLQVNDNGPVSATLSPAPVVDACHSYSRLGAETGDLTLQMPQNGIVADRHATGEISPAPCGGDRRSGRIEAHRDYLLGLIRRSPDMTLLEIQERLIANCGERF